MLWTKIWMRSRVPWIPWNKWGKEWNRKKSLMRYQTCSRRLNDKLLTSSLFWKHAIGGLVYILCAGTKNESSFVDTLACRIPICPNCRRISAICRFPKLQLLDSVRLHIRIKGYSIRTEKSYVSWIKRFILFHDKRHPNEMGKVEIETIMRPIVA